MFGAYVTNAWVLGNHVHHNGGDSLQASHNARFTTSHLYIGCNHFHDDRENAIDIKQANDVIITQNDLHGYEAVDSSAGAVVVIHNGPSRVWVLFNHVWDGVAGVVSTGSDDLFIVGNLIRNIRKTPGDTSVPSRSVYQTGTAIRVYSSGATQIVGNTIDAVDIGIASIIGDGDAFRIEDNIITNVAPAFGGYHLLVDGSSASVAAAALTHNLVFSESPTAPRVFLNGLDEDLAGFTAAAPTHGVGWLEADPAYLERSAGDYRLGAASPALDGALGLVTIGDVYFAAYGESIASDYAGNPRMTGPGIDLGAFERQP